MTDNPVTANEITLTVEEAMIVIFGTTAIVPNITRLAADDPRHGTAYMLRQAAERVLWKRFTELADPLLAQVKERGWNIYARQEPHP